MPRILVVDDERDVVTLIKFLLEKHGHSVRPAYNGKEALDILLDGGRERGGGDAPELILLDVMMPVLDGVEVVKRLDAAGACAKIPLVVLSAKGQASESFETSGRPTYFLEKPFDPKKLRLMIDTIFHDNTP